MLIEKSFPDSFLENKTLGDLCLWENKEKQRWNMSIRGSRVMSWMPGLRDLGLPRHSHMGIDLAVWTFFLVQNREEARPGSKVPPRMLTCSCSLSLWKLDSRERWGNQSQLRHLMEWKSPVLMAACDYCYVNGEAEKYFTWGHISHCSFLLWIVAVSCYCYKIPELEYF